MSKQNAQSRGLLVLLNGRERWEKLSALHDMIVNGAARYAGLRGQIPVCVEQSDGKQWRGRPSSGFQVMQLVER